MADSIPKLRRLLNEAQERIADLEAQGYGQVIGRFVDRVVGVEYIDNPDHLETIAVLQKRVRELEGVPETDPDDATPPATEPEE